MKRTDLIGAWSSAAFAMLTGGAAIAQGADGLLELSIEQLGDIRVTSVSRREESLNDAPAAVHVITRDDIRRSGVKSLPEALRLAPGVEVARNGAHDWTISMRGFNSDLSNKLLVLIDGRSVYSPLYAGVFWDAQHTFLEDVERIEVIAGPAGTTWGANAVNGVINVITRSTWDTEGGLVQVGAGDEQEIYGGLRYAGRAGEDVALRGYMQYLERDASKTPGGTDAFDDWDVAQAGFRLDWDASRVGDLTLQGDVYSAQQSARLRGDFTLGTLPPQNVPATIDIGGYNVLARWERTLDERGSMRLQAYYDHTERDIPFTFDEHRNTVDVEFLHQLAPIGRHDLIWGADVRVTEDRVRGSQFSTFTPARRRDRLYSVFLQDEIDLYDDRLYLTLGSKLQHNDYTGSEHQPNVRLAWLATGRQTLWAAVSRAVRVPARLNEDLELNAPLDIPGLPFPLYVNVVGDDQFESEELLARELGYRISVRSNLGVDVALFEHSYQDLQTNESAGPPRLVEGPPTYLVLPFIQGNGMSGHSEGATLAVNWEPMPHWRLNFQYARLDIEIEPDVLSTDTDSPRIAGNSPERQGSVYSYIDLPKDLSLFTGVRYVDELASLNVPSYVAVDVNLDWEISDGLEASLAVRNLNDEHHIEFGGGNLIERSAFVMIDWRF
jgi:iron complex outermembrane recepter protein